MPNANPLGQSKPTLRQPAIYRILASVLAIACLTFAIHAKADPRYLYRGGNDIPTSHPDWMSWLPGSLKISELSLPGTHDTMSRYGGDLVQTQTLYLDKQLNAGIRVLDIRARHINDRFAIHHGSVYQNANFGEVLEYAAAFLAANGNETIFMRLGAAGVPDPSGNSRSYADTYEWYRDKTIYGHLIWQRPGVFRERTTTSTDHCDSSNSVGGQQNYMPSLDEVRGKIVILQDFREEGPNGVAGPPCYGIWVRGGTVVKKQDETPVQTIYDIIDKWGLVEAHVVAADNGKSSDLYMNYLSDASGGAYPYTVAGGAPDVTGVNEFMLDYFMERPVKRTGMLMMDFPGAALIDAIIAQNFRLRDPKFPISVLADDFEYLFNNIAYDGTELGGPTQASYRRDRLKFMIDNVLPDQGMNYFVAQISHGGLFNQTALYASTDFIGTDNIFETRQYRAMAFSTKSPPIYTDPQVQAVVESFFTSTGGLSSPPDVMLGLLSQQLKNALPLSDWNVFVKDGPGGFDNWAYSVSPSANFYRKTIGSVDFVVVGTGNSCTSIGKPESLTAAISPDGRPLLTWAALDNATQLDANGQLLEGTSEDIVYNIAVFNEDGINIAQELRRDARYLPTTALPTGTYEYRVRGVQFTPERRCEGLYSDALTVNTGAPPILLPIDLASSDTGGYGSGTVSVNANPVWQIGGDYYAVGSTVSITAIPTLYSEFDRWAGTAAHCGSSPSCDVIMEPGISVRALFRLKPILNVRAYGNGTVTRTPFGSGCTEALQCSLYSTGDTVALTATAGALSTFDRWEGDPDCADGSVTVNQSISCTAIFSRTDYSLSVSHQPGTVVQSLSAGAINCPGDCTETYPASAGGQTIILTAIVDPGSVFVRWYGHADCWDEDENDGLPARISVTVGTSDVVCRAMSVPAGTDYALTVEKIGGGKGTVTASATNPVASAQGIDCPEEACSQRFPVNSQIQLVAEAARGSLFDRWNGDSDCTDGQVTMSSNVICSARFTNKVLLVDGSDDDNLRNEYAGVFSNLTNFDYDEWSVQRPTSTSNPGGRTEPLASDLAPYSQVIWYTANASAAGGGSSLAAGPSAAAEAQLSEYLDGGGCLLLSSSQYYQDRGLTSFAQNYLGIEAMTENVALRTLNGAGIPDLGFSNLGPYSLRTGTDTDAVVRNSLAPSSDVVLRYADTFGAAIVTDNDHYRTAFLGFPFLAMGSGNNRRESLQAFVEYCQLPDQNDAFETNDDFDHATNRQGLIESRDLKILPNDEDFVLWESTWFADTRFQITPAHAEGDLIMEIYDSTRTLIDSALSQSLNAAHIVVNDVDANDTFFIRIFSPNNTANRYQLDITAFGTVDRDNDGVADSADAFPDDPAEHADADGDFIGDEADVDDDNDGMSDFYENLYGLNPLSAADASADPDMDGFSNLDEFRAQSSPIDRDSTPPVPTINLLSVSGNSPAMSDERCDLAAGTIQLQHNEWNMLSLPCAPPAANATIGDVLGDDVSGVYGQDWIVFTYDPTILAPASPYVNPGVDGILEAGQGFWMIQLTNTVVTLDMPADSIRIPATVEQGSECVTTLPCIVRVLANPDAGTVVWNMVGNPVAADRFVDFDDLRLVNASALCQTGCSIAQASSEGLTGAGIFNYDGSSYTPVISTGAVLSPWKGYWIGTLTSAFDGPLALVFGVR